ncbi:MAG: SAM-dependent chlorinase/fluorinase [Pseudomonadota bacterium]
MILLFTDFGAGLYPGQMRAVLARSAPGVAVVDLVHDAPAFNVRLGAHLLAALFASGMADDVFLAVVDPGVGGARDGVVVQADGKWLVGPDNGLLSVAAARAADVRVWRVSWRPAQLAVSFHGRDLFAPLAADLARGVFPDDKLSAVPALQYDYGAADLAEVVYLDHYGNAVTGLRADHVPRDKRFIVAGRQLDYATVFGSVPPGAAFWYENSLGLVEIAVNGGSAAQTLGLQVGNPVAVA